MENGDKIKFTEDIATLKAEMSYIKTQVSNHIPTSLKELDERLDGLERKLAYWGGGITVAIFVLNIVLKLYG